MIVSKELLAACSMIVAAPAPAHGRASSVQERAQEILSHVREGQKLAPWQVAIVQCLRSRFMGDYAGEAEFQAAWGVMYDAAKAEA